MKTYLPIGTKEVTFHEMRRTRYLASHNGQTITVPLYRDKAGTMPYTISIEGFDESAVEQRVNATELKSGDLFTIEGKGETFMYLETVNSKIIGVNIANNKKYKIHKDHFTFNLIDLEQVKREYLNDLI